MASTVVSGSGGIVSGQDTVYTIVDRSGNPRVEAWMVLESQGIYPAAGGGIAFDLSPHFRRILEVQTSPISGGQLKAAISGTPVFASGALLTAMPVRGDFATPASARFMLYGHNMLSAGGFAELASGNTSGIRFLARVIGY